MIDYDELDERIRRIVREELTRHGCAELESLENADNDNDYIDSAGDRWTFDHWRMAWLDTSSGRYHTGRDAGVYGPFKQAR
ncbi:hypothetical protein [Nocardia grenadensis]|uniref:hypothetical protein n=1 Tax=Nocardia grenadensis TaxID=931537 RepID=UPI003D70F6CD